MARTIVGVLRGGTSSEYGLSLKTGAAIHTALPEERYETRDILIDKKGYWHHRGAPSTPSRALSQVDVVLNALHGGVGEDGTVQRILEQSGIPYAGSRPMQSAIALNKILTRDVLANAGIRMPQGISFTLKDGMHTGEMAHGVHARFAPPYVVKPPNDGAAMGVRVVESFAELPDAIADVLDVYGSALVEEYVHGEEASVGIIDGFRNEDTYVLPPAHVKHGARHLSREHHESGELTHHAPGGFTYMQKQSLMDVAKMAHRTLALSHFSRSDLMVNKRGVVYLLEINTNPGLYPGASFPTMLQAVGSNVTEYLEHVIGLARASR